MLTRKPATSVIGVLVVDDSSFMRNAITRHIQRDARFHVVGAAVNGREAVAKAKELRPDVITMDVEMPEMNGIEALRQILAETVDSGHHAQRPDRSRRQDDDPGAAIWRDGFHSQSGGFEQLHEKLLRRRRRRARARRSPILAVAAARAPAVRPSPASGR